MMSFPPNRVIIFLFSSFLCTSLLQAQNWANTDTTYPPGGTQNWTIGSNWAGGVAPATATTPTINGQGYALINSTVNTLAGFGVLGTGNVNRGLYIASGGALTTTGTFRLSNTNGNTTVDVASGGALTIGSHLLMNAGTGAFGRFTSAGETIVSGSINVATQTQLYVTGGNLTSNRVGDVSLSIGLAGSTKTDEGLVVQTGGNVSTTSTGWLALNPGGTYQISGGNLSITGNPSNSLFFANANATSLGGTFRVVGSGAQTINFSGLRYGNVNDQTKATWGFNLDNSANHITKLNFVANGNANGYFRLGTLDVRLEGGVLLSGTNSFVLLEAPSVTTLSNYTNSADYTGGTAKLWTQGRVDSTRDQITVTLTGAGAGTLNYTGVNSLTQNGTAYGYVNLGNVTMSEPMTVYLKTSGGTLSNFTTALTNAGVSWSSATGDYDVALSLTPSTSGGTYFAYDLAKIDAGMTLTGLAVDSTFGVGAGNSTTISSEISGGGGLVQNGAGTLILTGSNSYNGTTRINAGTLQIGSGGTSGAIGSNTAVTINGTLAFNRSDAITFSNTINGTGSLLQAGSGSVALTGTNSYSGSTTITAGTLSIGAGGTSGTLGPGNVTITGPGLLNFNRSDTHAVATAISGNGTLRQSGSGTLQLSGSNTNTGAVTATSGTILFDGANALSSSISQLSSNNATISLADGTVRTTTISTGDLSLDTGTFVFDIGTTSDRLTLSSGSATMSGTNTVKLNFLSQISTPGSWTLLSAASGLGGTWNLNESFTGVVQSGFSFSLSSNATALTLTAAASATDAYWKGNLSGNWSETSGGVSNWTSNAAGTTSLASPPGDSSDVYFSAVGSSNLTTTLGGDLTVKTVSITDPNGVTIQAGNTLTANSSSFAAFNIAAASGTTTINATLAGATAGLNKAGGGTLVLGGSNTYGGGTTLSAGTLTIHSDAGLGATSGAITISAGVGNSTSLLAGTDGISLNANRSLTLSSGTLILDSGSHSITVLGNISGSGTLAKSGSGSATLSGTNSFSGGLLVNSGTLAVSGGSAISNTGTVTLANTAGVVFSVLGSETIGSLQGGGSTGGQVSVASGQTLTVAESGSVTFAGAIDATGTFAMGGAGNLTLSNSVSGSGGLAVAGPGTLLLTSNNTLSGMISIQSGTLRVGSAGTSGSLGSAFVTNNGTLVFNRSNSLSVSNAISGSGSVVQSGSGTLVLSGNNSFNGGVTLSAGTVQMDSSSALGSGGAIAFNGGSLVYGNSIPTDISARLGSASSQTIQINTGANSVEFASGFGGAGSTLTKTGSGQLLLSGSNAYTGLTTVSAGNLRIANASALGSTAAGTVVANGASLEFAFTGNNSIGPEALTLNGSGTGGNGALRNISGNTSVNQFITLMGSTTIQSDSGTLTIEGSGSSSITRDGSVNATVTFTGNGNIVIPRNINLGTAGVVVASTGTVTLGATNSSLYTGATSIQSGTLVLAGATNSLSANGTISVSGGMLNIGSNNQTTAGLTLSSGTIAGTTGLLSVNAPNGFALQNGTVSARLGGNASLTKSTSGTVTLSGNNSFTGNTTINEGTVVLAGQGALGSSPNVVVNNGGSLLVTTNSTLNPSANLTLGTGTSAAGLTFSGDYNSSIGALTLSADSIIDLGTNNSVFLDITALNLAGYNLRFYNWDGNSVWSGNPGAGNDRIYVNGAINGGTLENISFYSGFGSGFLSTAFQIDSGLYANQIIAVPEPEVWLTCLILLGGVLFWKIRQPKKCRKNPLCPSSR